MTRQEHIDGLLNEYAARRSRDEADRDERVERTRREHPEIALILDGISALVGEGARRLLSEPGHGKELAAEMRARSTELTARLKGAIRAAGLPEDVLSLRPECPICKDFGYIENSFPRRYCKCFETALAMEMSDAAAEEHTFDTFRLDIFPDEIRAGQKVSQREVAKRVRRLLRDWADAFPYTDKANVFLMGKSGLGKTFLMDCVAARVRERGVPVMQMTGFRMLEAMRKRHMGSYETRDEFSDMLEAPLLILDDLGSEPMLNNITIEYLFTLLNERIAAGRHTMAATNFSMSEVESHYNERIASRLLDRQRTLILSLEGEDLRTRIGK